MPLNLSRLFGSVHTKPITIVSGLPRSGTSLMMKILEAGGMPILADDLRAADEDHPSGYYEWERANKLKEGDDEWVEQAQGKAVKVTSALLVDLPVRYRYRIIFMRREIIETLASQRQMLLRRGESADSIEDAQMAEMFHEHLKRVRVWLANQSHMQVLYVDYKELIENPGPHIENLTSFLNMALDVDAMRAVPDVSLYHQRKS